MMLDKMVLQTLITLDLDCNEIEYDIQQCIDEILQSNAQLI
jgi:hypothetical protein